jgi:hypothetical protein
MRIVIQCAATKSPQAKRFRTEDGRSVLFVAEPAIAPPEPNILYARPDDPAGHGQSWRLVLLTYNASRTENPVGLLPAYRLYQNAVYQRLVSKFGPTKVYILSAGWGLVSAEFLLPDYDITFSSMAPRFKRRRKSDPYQDFCMLPNDPDEIAFGKDYLPLFLSLTKEVSAPKTVFFNSSFPPKTAPGYRMVRYATATRTNWHYECANDLIDGRLS